MMDTNPTSVPAFRLAIRAEGNLVNGYLAPLDSMVGAILLGSLLRGVAENPDRFEAFKALMLEAVSDATELVTGTRPVFGTVEPAPEHERAGSA